MEKHLLSVLVRGHKRSGDHSETGHLCLTPSHWNLKVESVKVSSQPSHLTVRIGFNLVITVFRAFCLPFFFYHPQFSRKTAQEVLGGEGLGRGGGGGYMVGKCSVFLVYEKSNATLLRLSPKKEHFSKTNKPVDTNSVIEYDLSLCCQVTYFPGYPKKHFV